MEHTLMRFMELKSKMVHLKLEEELDLASSFDKDDSFAFTLQSGQLS